MGCSARELDFDNGRNSGWAFVQRFICINLADYGCPSYWSRNGLYSIEGATVDDLGRGTGIWIDSGVLGTVAISDFGKDPAAILYLSTGPNGGYPTAAAAFAGLTSDGHGGTSLALPGSTGSVDILGVLPSAISASQLGVYQWSLDH